MTRHKFFKGVFVSAMVLSVAAGSRLAFAADSAPRMETYAAPDGTQYFALTLAAPEASAQASAQDVVVVFNTSASQTDDVREKALLALKSFLANLPASDRVSLMAADLKTVPLTKGFVAPQSAELTKAFDALNARTPLGAMDMGKAIETAGASFAEDSKNARAVVYFGDGRSAAKSLSVEKFAAISKRLAERRVSFDSYVVGVKTDIQIVGALAAQTGGVMIMNQETQSGEEVGRALAAAATTPVVWPSEVKWPKEFVEVYPKQTPPLRADRESVFFGVVKGEGPFAVEYGSAKSDAIKFDVKPEAADDGNAYLAQLAVAAKVDGGAAMPLVDASSLTQARSYLSQALSNIKSLAREAVASGNVDGAEKLIAEAKRRDPNDPELRNLAAALEKRRGATPVKPISNTVPAAVEGESADAPKKEEKASEDDLNVVGSSAEPPAGAMAEGFKQEKKIIAQAIQAEVVATLNQARKGMSVDPDAAIQDLKMMLEKVRQAPDLDPDVRDQFTSQLQSALREGDRRKIEFEQRRQRAQESLAAAKERQAVAESLQQNQQKARQLMERFNALMDEGKYRDAEDMAAAEAVKTLPDALAPRAGQIDARFVENYTNIMATRERRQKAVVDTLYQVESANIPMADDQPILYPNADVWQELSKRRIAKYRSIDLAGKGKAEKKIEEALKSTTEMEFNETPLSEVINYLKERHGIEIQLDKTALEAAGVNSDSPVTRNLKGVALRSALRLMLRDLNLTYMIKDEVLLITSPEEAGNYLATKVYPVADLVLPIRNQSMGGMGGMMGGMGGGMSGGMGGSSGGMSGMSGMSGMGGSSGGSGMYNVPPEAVPAAQEEKSDKAKDSAKSDDRPASVKSVQTAEKSAETTKAADKISLDFAKNANPDAVCDAYFSTHTPKTPKEYAAANAAVRVAVRELMADKKYDHVASLINAALRHRQGQSWMYEALGIALQAKGASNDELERAIMSAVDFCDDTTDFVYIGKYLMRVGLNERALEIFKQASEANPMSPEPYMLGLTAARSLKDAEAKEWAALGILSQAWPKEQMSVWRAGSGAAEEILAQLKAEKKDAEVAAFKEKLKNAVMRDCVIIARYSGDAEIDLMVEEPTGSVCSYRLPRTSGGGILIGDAINQTSKDAADSHAEAYVCPKGFDGKYRVLLTRVWGNVTSGKIRLEMYTHYRSDKEKVTRADIPLGKEDKALVSFDLKGGRRTESINEELVANAVKSQLAVNQQIVSQSINSSIDSKVLAATSSGLSDSTTTNSTTAPYIFTTRAGAVGYQPVIITLPKGASMGVTAVVSADRRYVRITPSPMFSGVSEVNTFNYASGSSSSSSSGTGSGGFSSM